MQIIYCFQSGSPMKKCLVILLHNLKDIILIRNRAKLNFENSLNERLCFMCEVCILEPLKWPCARRMSRGEH